MLKDIQKIQKCALAHSYVVIADFGGENYCTLTLTSFPTMMHWCIPGVSVSSVALAKVVKEVGTGKTRSIKMFTYTCKNSVALKYIANNLTYNKPISFEQAKLEQSLRVFVKRFHKIWLASCKEKDI